VDGFGYGINVIARQIGHMTNTQLSIAHPNVLLSNTQLGIGHPNVPMMNTQLVLLIRAPYGKQSAQTIFVIPQESNLSQRMGR
jgi:hypothetical protein